MGCAEALLDPFLSARRTPRSSGAEGGSNMRRASPAAASMQALFFFS
jgi:hypothetical protein